MAKERPGIVVLGFPRSGTTLLRRILDAHPSIACPPETYVLQAAARFLHEESFTHGLKIGVLSGLSYAGFSDVEVIDRLRSFAFGFLSESATRQGKARWAEKTAFDAFHLDAIRKLCEGHVRFVCLQRHGLDVASSVEDLVHKTGGYVEELHAYVRRYSEPLQAYAHAWVDCANALDDLAQRDDAIDLRYEDLVRDPETVVRRVLAFLDEPWQDGLLERALASAGQVGFGDWKTYARKEIDTASIDRWRRWPGPAQVRLAEICNPTLERLGYPRVEAQAEDDDDARRRYELGLLINRMKAEKASK
jgi:protein-tyrosine sulfotransferase